MSPITRILNAIEDGDAGASDELLPLVYDELRNMAAMKLASEAPGQTLQPTALVHETYLRLVGKNSEQQWQSHGHFFGAAAEAMRRILVENARRKKSLKAGGEYNRQGLVDEEIVSPAQDERLLALDEALSRLAETDRQAAELVKLRYFSGLTIPQVAEVLAISPRAADRLWAYAKAWLHKAIGDADCRA